jgi:hypothetical protein
MFDNYTGSSLPSSQKSSVSRSFSQPLGSVSNREIAADFAKVFIDVLRTDVADLTFFVDELEQFLARQLVASSDDAGETAIVYIDFMLPATLAAEFKAKLPYVTSKHYCAFDTWRFLRPTAHVLSCLVFRA